MPFRAIFGGTEEKEIPEQTELSVIRIIHCLALANVINEMMPKMISRPRKINSAAMIMTSR